MIIKMFSEFRRMHEHSEMFNSSRIQKRNKQLRNTIVEIKSTYQKESMLDQMVQRNGSLRWETEKRELP